MAIGSNLIISFIYVIFACASSTWRLVNIDSSPLLPTDWNADMGLGSSIKIMVQSLYFITLWARSLYLGDVMRLLVLEMGTITWIRGFRPHLHNFRRISVIGNSWMNSGMGSRKILLLLAIFGFPAFPGTRVFPALGERGVSMDIDDRNIGDE